MEGFSGGSKQVFAVLKKSLPGGVPPVPLEHSELGAMKGAKISIPKNRGDLIYLGDSRAEQPLHGELGGGL
jgi:hypothetical protein